MDNNVLYVCIFISFYTSLQLQRNDIIRITELLISDAPKAEMTGDLPVM